jgi:hypothetical protein
LFFKPSVSGLITDGAPFLGFLIKPTGIFLHQKTKRRYKAKIAEIEYKRKKGLFTETEASRRSESVTAHLMIARSRKFRNNILYRRALGV